MREIREVIFRGKRTDNGEWVYGYYTKARYFLNKKEMHIIFEPDVEAFPHCEFTGYEEVLTETVGQYTGLTDKNGKRIFEGDIVRATIERAERCQSPRIENGVIGYDCIGMIGLILYKDKNGENVWSDFFNELSLSGLIEDYYFEIIGNIHDNPDILKGGGDNG